LKIEKDLITIWLIITNFDKKGIDVRKEHTIRSNAGD